VKQDVFARGRSAAQHICGTPAETGTPTNSNND